MSDPQAAPFHCTVSSFGFKHGASDEADWVLDVRFLANPFWVDDLRPLTGLDPAVRAYVLENPETGEFLDRATGLLSWTVDRCVANGRHELHIAVGCTGGRHRSVVVSTELAERLRAGGHTVDLRHRDVEIPDPR